MTKKFTGQGVLNYRGVNAVAPPDLSSYERAPLTTDYREFDIGHLWLESGTENIWMLTDKEAHVATWTLITGGGVGSIIQVNGGTNITTVNPTGPTVTVNLDDSVTLAGSLTISSLGKGVLQTNVSGLVSTSAGTDGQVLVGNTSGAPAWYTLTSADGSVVFNPGPGTLDLQATGGGGGGGLTSMPTDSGTATVSATGTIDVLGGLNINTAASAAHEVTVSLDNSISLSGTITSVGDITTTGGNLEVDTGDITATLGSITAGNEITAAADITTTGGNIEVDIGDINVTLGDITVGNDVTVGNDLTVSSLSNGVVQSSAAGLFSSSDGTVGQLLITDGAGTIAWANLTAGSNIAIDDSSVPGQITISASGGSSGVSQVDGGTNITTVDPTGPTVTVNLDDDVTLAGFLNAATTVTAGTGVTVTTGDVDISSGSLNLPTTTATDGQIIQNSSRLLHSYGSDNLFLGPGSGNFTLTGDFNLGLGQSSLDALTSGTRNVCMGSDAGGNLTTGSANNLWGVSTGGSLTSAVYNTFIGKTTGVFVTTGSYNTAIGCSSASNADGTGYGAGASLGTTSSSNILISNDGASESNTIRIGIDGSGDKQQNRAFIAGIYGVTPVGGIEVAIVDSNGQLGSVSTGTSGYVLTSNGPGVLPSFKVSGGGGGGLLTNPTDSGTATISGANAITLHGGTNIGTVASGASEVSINLDPSIILTGSVTAGTTLAAGTSVTAGTTISSTGNITSISGNVSSTAGSVSAGTTVTAGTSISSGTSITAGSTLASTGATTVGTALTVSGLGRGVVQSSAAGLFSSSEGTDGQVLIGSSTGAPAWASLTAGSGISITPGANSITITNTGGGGGGITTISGGDNIVVSSPTGPTTTVSLANPIAWNYAGQITMQGGNFLSGPLNGRSVALGAGSGAADFSVSVGAGSLQLSTGGYNTAVGYGTGSLITSGDLNALVGHNSGASITTGGSNTLVGYRGRLTSGTRNVGIGIDNYGGPTTGSYNTLINGGFDLASSESNNVLISNDGVVGDNNTIRIGTTGTGNFEQNKLFVAATYGTNIGTGSLVYVNSDGQLGTVTSDALPRSAFRAYQASNRANVTGDGSTYWLGANISMVEEYDSGGDFYPGNGAGSNAVFTAPITGLYNFTLSILLTNLQEPPPDPPVYIYVYTDPLNIVTTSKTYQLINPALVYNDEQTLFYTVFARMSAGDTAQFNCAIIVEQGTKTVGVGATHTWIGGFLIAT